MRRVDVAEVVQVEERGGAVDVVEDVSRRLVDRRRARPGRRVGRGAGVHRARLETVVEAAAGRRTVLDPAGERRLGRTVADEAAVDAAPREFAPQPPELDLRTAVHDHFEAGRLGGRRRRVVADSELHPDDLGVDRDRLGDDLGCVLGTAEHVDHVDLVRDVLERRVNRLAEQGLAGDARVDRDHPVALALQVFHHEIARPVPVGRRPDHGDGAHPLEDRADLGVGIGNGFEIGHRALRDERAV